MKIVIVGLGAAGFAAAFAARKQNRKAEIVIIDKKDYDLAHPCGYPFYLEGTIKDAESLKHDLGLERMNIKKYSNSEVFVLNTRDKEVVFRNLQNNETHTEKYDKLILALGAKPFLPPIDGVENSYKALDINDVVKIKKKIKNVRNAVIIGAGAIGLEKAVALKENKIKVTIIDIMKHSLPNLIDDDMSKIVEKHLEDEGINLLLGKNIKSIEKDKVVLEDQEVKTGMTILATGVRPNLDLVKETRIKINKGIIVDEQMKTSIKDVYAAGDCTESVSLINKKAFSSLLATAAYKQGAIAGANAAGGKTKSEGLLGTFVSKVGKLEIAATGFNQEFAKKNGYDVIIAKATAAIKPEWFPGSKKLTIKIIADKKNGKILGAQSVGEEGAASRINVISTAIKGGFTLHDLVGVEMAYCPAISDVKDVITIAAEMGLRRLDRK